MGTQSSWVVTSSEEGWATISILGLFWDGQVQSLVWVGPWGLLLTQLITSFGMGIVLPGLTPKILTKDTVTIGQLSAWHCQVFQELHRMGVLLSEILWAHEKHGNWTMKHDNHICQAFH